MVGVQQPTLRRVIARQILYQIGIGPDPRSLDVRQAETAAKIGRFIAVKLQQAKGTTTQHRLDLVLRRIDKQADYSHKGRNRRDNRARLLRADAARAGRIEHQADRVCAQLHRHARIF